MEIELCRGKCHSSFVILFCHRTLEPKGSYGAEMSYLGTLPVVPFLVCIINRESLVDSVWDCGTLPPSAQRKAVLVSERQIVRNQMQSDIQKYCQGSISPLGF